MKLIASGTDKRQPNPSASVLHFCERVLCSPTRRRGRCMTVHTKRNHLYHQAHCLPPSLFIFTTISARAGMLMVSMRNPFSVPCDSVYMLDLIELDVIVKISQTIQKRVYIGPAPRIQGFHFIIILKLSQIYKFIKHWT